MVSDMGVYFTRHQHQFLVLTKISTLKPEPFDNNMEGLEFNSDQILSNF